GSYYVCVTAFDKEGKEYQASNNGFKVKVKATEYPEAAPEIVDVSSSSTNGLYGLGSVVSIQVTYDKSVPVSGGVPTLLLESGATDRSGAYVLGSSSATLTSEYSVQAGDSSADPAGHDPPIRISLNGAPIKGSASALSARLDLPTG